MESFSAGCCASSVIQWHRLGCQARFASVKFARHRKKREQAEKNKRDKYENRAHEIGVRRVRVGRKEEMNEIDPQRQDPRNDREFSCSLRGDR